MFDIFSMAIGFGIGVIVMLVYCNAQLHLVADKYEEALNRRDQQIKKAFNKYYEGD